jgi:ABC-type multidrug transport system fused ATPase/permease subunit
LEYAFDEDIKLNDKEKEEKMWKALEKAQIADMIRNLEK